MIIMYIYRLVFLKYIQRHRSAKQKGTDFKDVIIIIHYNYSLYIKMI